MSDMQCPYCGASQDANRYVECEEDARHEHTCRECGKTFVFTREIFFRDTPYKADCLNGAEHRLAFQRSWPRKHSRMRCQDCGYERQATDKELSHNTSGK